MEYLLTPLTLKLASQARKYRLPHSGNMMLDKDRIQKWLCFFELLQCMNHSECVNSLLMLLKSLRYNPQWLRAVLPVREDTQSPLHAQEITLPLIIVVWVRTQCEVEILAIHTIEMIPKSMILILQCMVNTPTPTQY